MICYPMAKQTPAKRLQLNLTPRSEDILKRLDRLAENLKGDKKFRNEVALEIIEAVAESEESRGEGMKEVAARVAAHLAAAAKQPGVDLEETARVHILDAISRAAHEARGAALKWASDYALGLTETTQTGVADAVTNGWNAACVQISSQLSLARAGSTNPKGGK